ncbi:unnamed protein product [Rotaria magnacalcarata]|uniref:Uncharacterized protein n=2 Tax=Rotaria magnacalcarata TaxID=392030 RepID=A0A8S2SQY1_9BILA|nr:unnamed protein product [Rotaria magnacalcarata]
MPTVIGNTLFDQVSIEADDTQLETTIKKQHLSTNDEQFYSSHCFGVLDSNNLDGYRDSNVKETFSSKVEYSDQNLIEIVGKDFGDYARRVMRVLFTEEELRTSILPPKRKHLAREPLDSVRFLPVRVKYRLASHMYDEFYKYHLAPKLGDFLVDERRRNDTKAARRQAKVALSLATTDQSTSF